LLVGIPEPSLQVIDFRLKFCRIMFDGVVVMAAQLVEEILELSVLECQIMPFEP
jgi:hypothetical protein